MKNSNEKHWNYLPLINYIVVPVIAKEGNNYIDKRKSNLNLSVRGDQK